MPEIVINTGPIIALVVATESLEWLPGLYERIVIPYEVAQEIEAGGAGNPETIALQAIQGLVLIGKANTAPPASLLRELDLGEASVIHSAAINGIDTVAIDEKQGRRLARIHGLRVTGSIGILLKAKLNGIIPCLGDCITRMREHGIWISTDIVTGALRHAREE